MTGLVKSDFGYHIIKLEELKGAVAKPYSEVAAEIKQEMIDQKAVDQFYELQSELEKVAFEYPDSLDDASKAVGQEVKTTDFISQVDAPEVLKNPAVIQAILSPEVKEDGLNSEAIEIAPEHIIVVRVEDARDETVLPLDEVKGQVVAELSRVKGEQGAIELGTKVVAALKEGNTDILAENNLAFGEQESIDRRSPLATTVFAMAKPVDGKPMFGQSKDLDGNIVVIELDAVHAELDSSLEQQVATQMLRASAQQDLSSVVAVLRENTDIEYFVVSN
ncbi:Peptidylprolyl isomerase [Vibrio sp. B1REV9]|nr:Peptidylprolyl isomerase [Vibrio sp. B1REV9]